MEFTAIPSRFQDSTYVCGTITDEIHKITVNISNSQLINIPKGNAVKVVGEVNNNPGNLICSMFDYIRVSAMSIRLYKRGSMSSFSFIHPVSVDVLHFMFFFS